MGKSKPKYMIDLSPSSRISTIDIGVLSRKKHHVTALLELDVTDARRMIKNKRKEIKEISFTAWLIKCISKTIEEVPKLHGVIKGKKKIFMFDDIDISIMIEREIDGKKVPLPYVIRKTNEKSIADIDKDIKSGQAKSIENESGHVLSEKKNKILMKFYYFLPGILRRLIWKLILKNPVTLNKNMGTVMVSSIGMVGELNGWFIPMSIHPLTFAVGSIIKKAGVVKNEISIREYLHITVLVDHDVIDGAPAIRALNILKKLIQKGFMLE